MFKESSELQERKNRYTRYKKDERGDNNEKKGNALKLTTEQKTNAIAKIRACITDNLDTEISNLQAEILVDFISKNIGVYYYNKAIADSLSFITERIEDLYLLMKDED